MKTIKKNIKYACSAQYFGLDKFTVSLLFSTPVLLFLLILNLTFGFNKQSLSLILIILMINGVLFINKKNKINFLWNLKFSKFIKNNKLGDFQTIDGKQIFKNSATIYYFLDSDSYLHIQIYTKGNHYTKKAQNLDAELMSLVKKELTNKLIFAEYTEYIFYLSNNKRYSMSEELLHLNSNRDELSFNHSVNWNLYKEPHLLVVGGTGSGKTFFLQELILKAYKKKMIINIIDPKKADLYQIGVNFFNENTADSTESIIDLLTRNIQIMNERYELIRNGIGTTAKDHELSPILIFFDEVSAAIASCSSKDKKSIHSLLATLILKGRQAGIFIILATQRPDTDAIPGNIRDQLSVKIAFGNLSQDGLRMTFGSLNQELTSIDNTEKGHGYIQFSSNTGNPQKFVSSYWETNFNYIKELKNVQSSERRETLKLN